MAALTVQETLQQAAQKLQEGKPEQALAVLDPCRDAGSQVADFWQLLALAHKGLGASAEAEAAFLANPT